MARVFYGLVMQPLCCNTERASSMGNGFLSSVSSVQSPLNGSTAFADQKLLRLDPLLRPLLQLLDGFHTIQFSRRSIILQWRVFGTKNFVQ